MKITIPGEVISKKNSRIPVRRGKQIFIIPSKAYSSYEKMSVKYCSYLKKWTGDYPVVVEIFIYRKTLRKFDFDNMQASVNDVLVKSGILADDSMRHILPKIKDHGWEKDKSNPRVEVSIWKF